MTGSQIRRALQAIDCAVSYDNTTRQLYATDASIHQLEPLAVAFPKSAEQAATLIRVAADAGVSLTPRGAGTGLVGGAIGEGLIVDFARHNQEITHLNLDARTVRVGAGVVLDQLNAFLRPHGFVFGPDVATSSRATLGGMVANNSSGSHVPIYGTTADHVKNLEVILADGRVAGIGLDHSGLSDEGQRIQSWVQQHAATINARLPADMLKRWPGYGIDRFLREPKNLCHILAGSEGTLAGIWSAELKIVPLPRARGVGLLFFSSVGEALQATVDLLDLQPAAIEHIDDVLFDQTKGQQIFQGARDLLELDTRPCKSILLVEFFDHDVAGRLQSLKARKLGQRSLILRDAAEAATVWNLRKAGLALLAGCAGDAKPVTGIEDVAVRPQQLPAYHAAVEEILKPLGLTACYYGHAASGLLHIRPVLDLHSVADLAKFRRVMNEVSALVCQFKGSLAGEHGVGLARTEFLPGQLGSELFELLNSIKHLFDPRGRFNPGKVVGNGRFRCDQDLRWRAGASLELPFHPALAFAAKDGSFVRNLEQCNGCGGCRKAAPTMCPTFVATEDEVMSTRGRANLIRAALEGRGMEGRPPLQSAELEVALAYCLGCKACTNECPSNVNLALLKAELLNARHHRYGVTAREQLLSSIDALGRLGTLAPGLVNTILRSAGARRILSKVFGLAAQRPLPPYASERFDHWFKRRRGSRPASRGEIILWDDTFVRYHEPHIGRAAIQVLEAAGFQVRLGQGRHCCGRPAFSQGLLEEAAWLGRRNLALLAATDSRTPILFLEPSCHSMFIEDYREMNLPNAESIGRRSYLFEEFLDQLLSREPKALRFTPSAESISIHVHCHTKALRDPTFLHRLLEYLPGRRARLLNSGCCGMAGAFGAVESTYALSCQVGAPLMRLLADAGEEEQIVAAGTSCRHQIEHLSSVHARHPAEVLAAALET